MEYHRHLWVSYAAHDDRLDGKIDYQWLIDVTAWLATS